jgi:hypothetical protein
MGQAPGHKPGSGFNPGTQAPGSQAKPGSGTRATGSGHGSGFGSGTQAPRPQGQALGQAPRSQAKHPGTQAPGSGIQAQAKHPDHRVRSGTQAQIIGSGPARLGSALGSGTQAPEPQGKVIGSGTQVTGPVQALGQAPGSWVRSRGHTLGSNHLAQPTYLDLAPIKPPSANSTHMICLSLVNNEITQSSKLPSMFWIDWITVFTN